MCRFANGSARFFESWARNFGRLLERRAEMNGYGKRARAQLSALVLLGCGCRLISNHQDVRSNSGADILASTKMSIEMSLNSRIFRLLLFELHFNLKFI